MVTHKVEVETLTTMSAADLDHCIATNVIADLPRLQQLFADYLWSDDGETPPTLPRGEPRQKR